MIPITLIVTFCHLMATGGIPVTACAEERVPTELAMAGKVDDQHPIGSNEMFPMMEWQCLSSSAQISIIKYVSDHPHYLGWYVARYSCFQEKHEPGRRA